MDEKREVEKAVRYVKSHGQMTTSILLAAFLVWLFGVLVFIPLAESINWQTRVFVSLLFFAAFSLLIFGTMSSAKKLIDAFAFFPARKYGVKKGLSYANALTLFRYLFYIVCAVILYGLYYPFLTSFHPAVNGIVLIVVLILIFFLFLRIFSILLPKFAEWLVKT